MRNYPLRTDNPNALIKLDDGYKLANAAFYDGYIVGRLRNKKKKNRCYYTKQKNQIHV